MPYTVSTSGMDDVNRMLKALGDDAGKVASAALYEGAGIMADAIQRGAESIATAPFKYATGGQTRLPSPEEKEIVAGKRSVGIAKFKTDGMDVDTSVGYGRSGYAMLAGKKVAVPLIANSINSGTSFMKKQPFVRKAASTGGKRATDAIRASIEKNLQEIIDKNGG